MTLWKMHGCGNDFLVFDNRSGILTDAEKPAFTARICDRHFGVGADGLIALENSPCAAFKMAYFNADGTEDMMCGNGIRCLSKFARDTGAVTEKEFPVETGDGIKRIRMTEESEKCSFSVVDMGSWSFRTENIGIRTDEEEFVGRTLTMKDGTVFPATCIHLGVNHCIVFVDDDRDYPELYGAEIENLPIFLKDMNVHFTRYVDAENIVVKSWERGAGKTLACGTGSSAAAVVTARLKDTADTIRAKLPGGVLKISVEGDHVIMEGPAEKVAEIVLPSE